MLSHHVDYLKTGLVFYIAVLLLDMWLKQDARRLRLVGAVMLMLFSWGLERLSWASINVLRAMGEHKLVEFLIEYRGYTIAVQALAVVAASYLLVWYYNTASGRIRAAFITLILYLAFFAQAEIGAKIMLDFWNDR